MGFFKKLKDAASGRTLKINSLFGNHAIKICEEYDGEDLIEWGIAHSTMFCTIQFLDTLFYDVADYRNSDGTIEVNPFKKNINLLNSNNSILLFNLVASNFIVNLFFGENKIEYLKYDDEISSELFSILRFNDSDISIFNELLKLSKKDEPAASENRVYEYIFEKVFKIEAPTLQNQKSKFIHLYAVFVKENFVPKVRRYILDCFLSLKEEG
jgi:hypothetical protein